MKIKPKENLNKKLRLIRGAIAVMGGWIYSLVYLFPINFFGFAVHILWKEKIPWRCFMGDIKLSELAKNFNRAILVDFDREAVWAMNRGKVNTYPQKIYDQFIYALYELFLEVEDGFRERVFWELEIEK